MSRVLDDLSTLKHDLDSIVVALFKIHPEDKHARDCIECLDASYLSFNFLLVKYCYFRQFVQDDSLVCHNDHLDSLTYHRSCDDLLIRQSYVDDFFFVIVDSLKFIVFLAVNGLVLCQTVITKFLLTF